MSIKQAKLTANAHKAVALTEFCTFIPLSLTRFVFQENFLHTGISGIKIVFEGLNGIRIVFQGHSGIKSVFQGLTGIRIVFQDHSRIRQLEFSEVCCFVFVFAVGFCC